MRAVRERQLGAGDRTHAEVLGRVCELERAVDPVVVGERERWIAELGGADGELFRQRRPVEERVRRVGVQLDVRDGTVRCASGEPPGSPEPPPLVRFADRRLHRLLLPSPVRELRLQLERHTRSQCQESCTDPARARRSSADGS